jgi:hypothetical protein
MHLKRFVNHTCSIPLFLLAKKQRTWIFIDWFPGWHIFPDLLLLWMCCAKCCSKGFKMWQGFSIYIDGHVAKTENRWKPFNVCWPKTTNFCFLFPFAANKWKFAFSVFSLKNTNGSCHFPLVSLVPFSVCENLETWRHGHRNMEMETLKHGDINTWRHGEWRNRDMETWNGIGKLKPRRFSIIRWPLAHCANRSLSFVRLLMKKQTEVIYLQTD